MAVRTLLVGSLALVAGCRPDSVTGARERLTDGDSRTVTYRLPLARESYGALRFLEDASTVILDDGLVAVPLLPGSVRGRVGFALLAARRVELEVVERVAPDYLDLGELGAAVAASEVRTAPLQLTLHHTSAAALRLVEPALSLVRTDAGGEPARNESGGLDLERDASGHPLRVRLSSGLTVAPGERLEIERDGARLVDRLAELLVARDPVAVVLTALLETPPGEWTRVRPGDVLVVGYRALVGLDLVLPDSGVVIRREELADGLGFSRPDVDQIGERVIRAGSRLKVTNELPFGVRVYIAYVGGDRVGENVFGAADRVVLDSLTVAGRPDRMAGSPLDTLEVTVSGAELRPLLGDVFTVGIRIRLLPGPNPAGRGALRADELVHIDAGVFADVRAWNGS